MSAVRQLNLSILWRAFAPLISSLLNHPRSLPSHSFLPPAFSRSLFLSPPSDRDTRSFSPSRSCTYFHLTPIFLLYGYSFPVEKSNFCLDICEFTTWISYLTKAQLHSLHNDKVLTACIATRGTMMANCERVVNGN